MNKEKTVWVASVMLLGLLAFQLPGTMAQRDDDYSFVRTLVDIHRQVKGNYAEAVDEEQLRLSAIEGMLQELDPFSVYVPPARQEEFDRMLEGSFKGVGIQIDQLDNGLIEVVTPIDGSPAFKAGVLAGDVILKVDGESIEGMKIPEVIQKIGGPLGSEVTLTVRHADGREEDLTMTRQEVVVPTVLGYERAGDNTWDFFVTDEPKIAYVRMTQFTPETAAAFRSVMQQLLKQGMEGLIFDLRFNPGGRLDQAVNVIDLFLEEGTIVSTRGRNRPENVIHATQPGTLPYFPMIVLVNEHSASASEIVAGSLADNRRAVVIGTRTYGKGSVQEVIPLDGNKGELKLTVAYYYLPSGRLVHRKKDATDWGVEPQIVVPMTQEEERAAMQARLEAEAHRRPLVNVTTRPTTAPATQPVDAQLQRALDTLVALLVLQGDGERPRAFESQFLTPTTAPTTVPATQPAESVDPIEVPTATDPMIEELRTPATEPTEE